MPFTYTLHESLLRVSTRCIAANHVVNLVENSPATTTTLNSPSVTVNEGSQATNGGTFNDADGDPVTITASVGTISRKLGTSSGTWSWTFTPPMAPIRARR